MKIVKDVEVYVAEDGARFLDQVEAHTHEAVLYIGRTVEAFGHEQVALAIKAVSTVEPRLIAGLAMLYNHLRGLHASLPVNHETPTIASVNAPENVRASGVGEPPLPDEIAREDLGGPLDPGQTQGGQTISAPITITGTVETPAKSPSLLERWRADHPGQPDPGKPEEVQKPDETPRDPDQGLPSDAAT